MIDCPICVGLKRSRPLALEEIMSWVSSRLSDGLGNRLFQISCCLGASELWKKKAVFFTPRICDSVHSDCSCVFNLFPDIEIVDIANSWYNHNEEPYMCWNYEPLPQEAPAESVVLNGYWQSERYFPKSGITLNFQKALGEAVCESIQNGLPSDPESLWFAHIRLGDYMSLPHHQINLSAYLKETLSQVPEGAEILIFSDSPEKARELINGASEVLKGHTVHFIEGLDALSTLYMMSLCGGGCILTNSTFSWWGGYLSSARKKGAPIYAPSKWVNYKVPQEGIYSDWMTKIFI